MGSHLKCNYTPLHSAILKGNLGVIEYLVNQKADLSAKTDEGKTPLEIAKENELPNVVEFLKSYAGQ